MSMRLNPLPFISDILSHWQASKERRQVSRKPNKDKHHNIHDMSIAELNELDDEDYSEDEIDIADTYWENVEEEISESEVEDIQRECEQPISLRIGMSASIGNDNDDDISPQLKKA